MELANDGTVLEVQGARIPRLGFGTWLLEGDDAYDGVRDALEIGYRHIDTARAYENEQEVGRAIADSGLDRGELWITTKIWTSEFAAGDLERAAEDSLRNLRVDHVDLLLLHWPNPEVPLEESLRRARPPPRGRPDRPRRRLQLPRRDAPARAGDGAAARRPGRVPPVPRPGRAARRLRRERAHAHRLLAARPWRGAQGPRPQGDRRRARQDAPARWRCAGCSTRSSSTTAPKASSHDRRLENFEVFDFALTEDDRERIAALPKDRRRTDPPWAPDWAA